MPGQTPCSSASAMCPARNREEPAICVSSATSDAGRSTNSGWVDPVRQMRKVAITRPSHAANIPSIDGISGDGGQQRRWSEIARRSTIADSLHATPSRSHMARDGLRSGGEHLSHCAASGRGRIRLDWSRFHPPHSSWNGRCASSRTAREAGHIPWLGRHRRCCRLR